MQYTGRRYIDETRNDLPDHSLSDIVHTDSGHYELAYGIVHAELSDTQQSLAKEVFRFHVIAESDSANDQRIKLKVRDAVLKYMKAHMTRAERRDAKATKVWTLTHKKELTDTADKILKKEKVSYRAKAEVTTCYFPDKRYGDIIFPEGNYEALRIVLGKGNGHNWWCVLYPNLCFTNATWKERTERSIKCRRI